MDLAPADYYPEFLQRVLEAVDAPAGAVWLRTADGHFQEQCRLNPGGVRPPESEAGRARHHELLRQVVQQARPAFLPPAWDAGPDSGWALLMTPALLDLDVAAVLEVWVSARRPPPAIPGLVQFLVRMADLASVYLHRAQEEKTDPQKVWEQLDAFARRAHGSLDPTEVAYRVANEGRQLVGGDRLSVALRPGRRAVVEAVSGVELVDRRSNLSRRMRRLCDRVLDWGEKLVYRGTPDETLPPAVLRDLDAYLEVSHSKVLVLLPVRDERGEGRKKPRAALLLECFETALPVDRLVERLETISRHAGVALYNASAYRQIPLRFLWQPLVWAQAGLGGKARAIAAAVAAAVLLVVAALVFVPYPLKLDAKGQMLPQQRQWIYAPVEGQVVGFAPGVEPGALVRAGEELVLLYDVQLESKLVQLGQEAAAIDQDITTLNKHLNNKELTAPHEGERLRLDSERRQKEALRDQRRWELRALRARTNSDPARPGNFWLKAPFRGTVLSWDFRETLTNRQVKPSEPLLRLGDKDGAWEVELKIPQKHMGQIVRAFAAAGPRAELDVDLLALSAPTRTFKGRLARGRLGGEASPNKDDPNEAEPVVLAGVRIDGADIPPADRLPRELLVTGTEVHAKVRCGNHPMGYSLLYGVWEFFYEKVVFFF
jgi:hypothetical protein